MGYQGFSKIEIAEILTHLNRLLASYQVHFNTLRGFHWAIEGQDYFDLSRAFKELYEKALLDTNEIAKRIRLFDQKPVHLMQGYLKLSAIEENGLELTGFEMIKLSLKNINELLSLQRDCINKASEIGDYGTEQMVKNFTYELEKDQLRLTSWLK